MENASGTDVKEIDCEDLDCTHRQDAILRTQWLAWGFHKGWGFVGQLSGCQICKRNAAPSRQSPTCVLNSFLSIDLCERQASVTPVRQSVGRTRHRGCRGAPSVAVRELHLSWVCVSEIVFDTVQEFLSSFSHTDASHVIRYTVINSERVLVRGALHRWFAAANNLFGPKQKEKRRKRSDRGNEMTRDPNTHVNHMLH